MASLPVSLVPTGSGAPAPAEGATPSGVAPSSDNQAAGQAFAVLMKQAVPQEKKPKAEDMLLAMTAAVPVPPSGGSADPLPVAGTALPPALPQPDGVPVPRPQDGAVQDSLARGKGQAVLTALAGARMMKPGGNQSAPDAPASTLIDDDKHAAARFGADLSAQLSAAAIAGGPAAPNLHQAAQFLPKDMTAFLGEHRDAIGAAHGADGAATNQGAGALLQSGDKAPVAAPTTAPSIAVPLRHPEWADELGNRISWMVRQDVQSASVKLNPPHLGPLEVKVSMVNDQVNVSFTTHHAPVREALDASLPRLRDMLGDSGLQLGDANVTHRSYSDQQQSGQGTDGHAGGGDYAGGASADEPVLTPVHQPLHYVEDGAVDLYA